jgi:hypothetical protein
MSTDDDEINPADPQETSSTPGPRAASNLSKTVRRLLGARVGRVPVGGIIGAVALVSLLGGAYVLGSPAGAGNGGSYFSAPGATAGPMRLSAAGAPVAGPVTAQGALNDSGSSGAGSKGLAALPSAAPAVMPGAPTEQNQVIKTGSIDMEVSDLDKAVAQAQSAIVGMGGSVSQLNQSGEKDSSFASAVYRVPAARFDDAMKALSGLATRVVNKQTASNDVTAQVIDYDARLANLQATEAALQSIMARATAIPDVLAVETQLSNTQGQIEELTAQRDGLKNQAAMSTLAVTFSLPGKTVTTTAAQGWDFGAQVDDAAATLIRIGQGLVTIGVWAVVVGLPILIGLAFLLGVLWVLRRVSGRRHSSAAQV